MAELRSDLGRSSVDLAEKIIGESLADDVKRAGTVDRFLNELDSLSADSHPEVSTMYAASREALAHTRSARQSALGSGAETAAAAQAGSELFSVVEALDEPANPSRCAGRRLGPRPFARRWPSRCSGARFDPGSRDRESRGMARTGRRLRPDQLARALGRESLLGAAANQDQLDTVEDELFRLGRIASGNGELEQALSDRNTSVEAKRELLSRLLYGKSTAITSTLAVARGGRLQASPADTFDELSALAATQRDRAVAHVRSCGRSRRRAARAGLPRR